MKRQILPVFILITPGLVPPAAALAANIDLKESSAGIPLPWLLLAAFGVALVVTLIVRALIGRRQANGRADA